MTRAEREAVAAVAQVLIEVLANNAHLHVEYGIRRLEQVQRVMLPEDTPPQSTTAKEH